MNSLSEKHAKLIQGKNFGFLATLNSDGSPQVTPVWVDTEGGFILVNTAIGRVKERNTRKDPRVSISIAKQEDPYSWIMINGQVTEWIEGGEAEDHIDKLANKYTGARSLRKAIQANAESSSRSNPNISQGGFRTQSGLTIRAFSVISFPLGLMKSPHSHIPRRVIDESHAMPPISRMFVSNLASRM